MSEESLDIFGEFLVKNLRDKGIWKFDNMVNGLSKAPKMKKLQDELSQFSPEQVEVIRKCFIRSLDSAIHDFLFALQERADFQNDIQLLVNGRNVVELSEMLHGEVFLEDGWFARFSEYGESFESNS
jgi:hypothetical protein